MDTITRAGMTFLVHTEQDHDAGKPWEREEGHGVIRAAKPNFTGYMQKSPGEVILSYEFNRSGWAYDYAGAILIAHRDKWGLTDEDLAMLTRKLQRTPTMREERAFSVRRDMVRMRGWLDDNWTYIGVVVTLLDADGDPTDLGRALWGIESDASEYHAQVAGELADEIADVVGRCKYVTGGAKRWRVRP